MLPVLSQSLAAPLSGFSCDNGRYLMNDEAFERKLRERAAYRREKLTDDTVAIALTEVANALRESSCAQKEEGLDVRPAGSIKALDRTKGF